VVTIYTTCYNDTILLSTTAKWLLSIPPPIMIQFCSRCEHSGYYMYHSLNWYSSVVQDCRNSTIKQPIDELRAAPWPLTLTCRRTIQLLPTSGIYAGVKEDRWEMEDVRAMECEATQLSVWDPQDFPSAVGHDRMEGAKKDHHFHGRAEWRWKFVRALGGGGVFSKKQLRFISLQKTSRPLHPISHPTNTICDTQIY
jgi:hypothetical protein